MHSAAFMDIVLALQPSAFLFVVLLIVAAAAFAHGLVGVGYPLITTPVIALLADLKTAVLITVLPNIAVNLVSIVRGGNWRASIGRHWPVALYVLIGSIIGTHILIGMPAEPMKLALAVMILVYLNLSRMKKLDWSRLRRYPRVSEAGFGLAAGVLSGTVNVTVPPLAIYFMALNLAPAGMVQLFNLCFIVGKGTQAATLGAAHQFTANVLWLSAALTVLSMVFLWAGLRIQGRMSTAAYQRWLNATLFVMAAVLIAQVGMKWWG